MDTLPPELMLPPAVTFLILLPASERLEVVESVEPAPVTVTVEAVALENAPVMFALPPF